MNPGPAPLPVDEATKIGNKSFKREKKRQNRSILKIPSFPLRLQCAS